MLRPSLLPGLIDSCAHNRRRGRRDVRLFETGSRFTASGEGRAVGLVCMGPAEATHWSTAERMTDFYDVKGIVDLLLAALGADEARVSAATVPYLAAGRAAVVSSGETVIGTLGQLLPSLAEARGMPAGEEVYVVELDTDALAACAPARELRAESLPKYPTITRDLSILVGEALPAAAVRGTIRSAAPEFLESIVEFDRYQGKGIPDGSVSLSVRLTFRSAARTLTDQEVEAAMTTIVAALEREHAAQRR